MSCNGGLTERLRSGAAKLGCVIARHECPQKHELPEEAMGNDPESRTRVRTRSGENYMHAKYKQVADGSV